MTPTQTEREAELVSVDANVVVEAIIPSDVGQAYADILDSRRAALTYFVRGELRAGRRSQERATRLEAFVEAADLLPTPNEDLLRHYVRANRIARALGLGKGVGEDLWMIAQTEQHGAAFASHDRNAARVAKAMELTVYTILPDIEADYARDQARLARQRS